MVKMNLAAGIASRIRFYQTGDRDLLQSGIREFKMAKTSNHILVVEAGGKLYSTTKEIKVTVGGCGG